MKKYLLKILVLFISVCASVGIFIGYIFTIPDGLNENIAATLRYKIPLIQNTETPRIILVGGSSSPYGVNCSKIAEETGKNCICIGATAYLGKEIYFNILEDNTVPGDIVVLGFENNLLREKSVDYNLIWQGAGNHKNVWKYVPLSYYPGLFTTTINYFQIRKMYSVYGQGDTYNKEFGPLGDVTLERETLLEFGYLRQDMRRLDIYNISNKELDKINKFSQKMEERGVKVYFAYAPLDELCVTSSPQDIEEYNNYIRNYLTIPVVVPIDDALMAGEYFYNTNNHLTSEGADIYSDYLIKGLNNLQ